MSDTAARARELAEIRAMSNEDLMSKFRTEPSDKWFDYREELLKRLAAQSAAPVEELSQKLADACFYWREGTQFQECKHSAEVMAIVLRQYGYGAQGK